MRAEDSPAAPSGRQPAVMTIGGLSRRTGVPVKTLRQYEDLGLIYSVGRSAGNYRLFDEEALCRPPSRAAVAAPAARDRPGAEVVALRGTHHRVAGGRCARTSR